MHDMPKGDEQVSVATQLPKRRNRKPVRFCMRQAEHGMASRGGGCLFWGSFFWGPFFGVLFWIRIPSPQVGRFPKPHPRKLQKITFKKNLGGLILSSEPPNVPIGSCLTYLEQNKCRFWGGGKVCLFNIFVVETDGWGNSSKLRNYP